jgi:hypothetical protein
MFPSPKYQEIVRMDKRWYIYTSEGCLGNFSQESFKTYEEAEAWLNEQN